MWLTNPSRTSVSFLSALLREEKSSIKYQRSVPALLVAKSSSLVKFNMEDY